MLPTTAAAYARARTVTPAAAAAASGRYVRMGTEQRVAAQKAHEPAKGRYARAALLEMVHQDLTSAANHCRMQV